MASNLLDELSAAVGPQLLSAASAQLGESQSSVSKGLLAALPLLLGALTEKAQDPSMLSRIMSLLTSRANSPDVLTNPNAILAGEPSATGMTELAGNLLSSVFGGQTGAVTQALSEYAGVRSTSASSLMTLASGLVTAALGERVRRQGLNGAGLLSLL